MITAKLNGGLGNQMFQIAAAYSLAIDNGDTCAFDLSAPVVKQGNSAITYKDNIFKNINVLPDGWKPRTVYKELSSSYSEIPYSEGMQLMGYFQSDKYFKHNKKAIIDLFSIDLSPIDVLGIHVRRGDYFGVSECKPLDMEYYNSSIHYLDERIVINRILVFSDDISWCRDNMNDKRMEFISGTDYEDFIMFYSCRYKTIANSSFSGMASILSGSDIIIAPQEWGEELSPDIYTKEMMIL